MTALIARAHLTPAASTAVDQLLRGNPIDPALRRYCKDRPGDPMSDAATWADDARTIEKTAEWHYIDIPLAIPADSRGKKDVTQWCAPAAGRPGCIVTALEYELGILRDGKQPAAARAKALRYVIHFAGDLEQPLHASDNHDRGAGCTTIRYLAEAKPENLHAIWDHTIIQGELEATGQSQMQYAAALDAAFARQWSAWGASRADIRKWTWESHALAAMVAYPGLKPPIPVASANAGPADQAACNSERDQSAAAHVSIDKAYVQQALPVIREQLARGGYHLAGLLNQTFGPAKRGDR